MKKFFLWTGIVLLSPLLLFIILTILLYLPPVQNWAVDKIAEIASEKTGLQITVDKVDLDFPLDLGVDGVRVVRPPRDTIADVGRIVVDVELLPLLKKQVVVKAFEVDNAQLNTVDYISDLQVKGRIGHLSASSRAIGLGAGTVDLNDTRLADADLTILLSDTAAVDTTTSETPWLINVDSLTIDRSRVEVHMPGDSMQVEAYLGHAQAAEGVVNLLKGRYTVRSLDVQEGSVRYDQNFEPRVASGLDYNHIALDNLSLGVDSVYYQSPELVLKIRQGAFKEQSGLELTQMEGVVMMDSAMLRVPRISLKTPHSNIRARADMDLSIADSLHPGKIDAELDAQLGKADMLLFMPDQTSLFGKRWPEWPLSVRASLSGNMQHADIRELDVTLPTAFHATAHGSVGSFTDLTSLMAQLDVDLQTYDLGFATALVPQLGKDSALPKGLQLSGKVKANGPQYDADLVLQDGRGTAKLVGRFNERTMSYDADIRVNNLNLHRFLPRDSLYELTASVKARGQGFDFMKKNSWLEADAYVNHLRYGHLSLDSLKADARLSNGHAIASVSGHNRLLDGTITADALLGTDNLHATIGAELNRLDLKALNLVEDQLAIGGCGHIDISSNLKEKHQLTGFISDLYIHDSLKVYRPEDVGLLLRTDRDTTLARVQSGNLVLKLDAQGGYEPLLNRFLTLADTLKAQLDVKTLNQTNIKPLLPRMRLYVTSGNNNPVANFLRSSNKIDFKDLLVDITSSPESGINGEAHLLSLNVDSMLIDTINVKLKDTDGGLSYSGVVANNKKNPQFVFRTLFDGRLYDRGAIVGVRFFDEQERMGLRLGTMATIVDDGLRFHLVPEKPTIGYKEFTLNEDNYLLLRKNMKLEAKVDLIADDGTGVKVYSENQDSTYLQDLTVSLHKLNLGQLTSVLPYVPRITGELNGDYHLVMNQQKQISVATDMDIKQMTYEQCPLGNVGTEFVYLQREDDTHALEGRLLLDDKEVGNIKGEYRNAGAGHLNANMKLTHFPLALVNGFIPDQLLGFEGFAEGEMSVVGSMKTPKVDGEVYLDSAALLSVPYGVRLRFDDDPVRVVNSQLLLENFTMYAYNDEPLNIMGNIDFHNTDRVTMDVRMRARNFQLVNSKQTKQSIAYGKAFVNVFARMNGRLDQLRMRGRLDVLGTTDLTYILLDSPLSTDNQLDELVKFTDFSDSTRVAVERPTPDGLNADLTVSIDQGAHVMCALNVDETNYVDIFGGGDLRMKYDHDGISMTGRYTLTSGEMKYSLPVIPLKTFTIQDGSYVEFTGDPTNPRLNLTATERTKATVGGEDEQTRSVAFDCGVVITKTLNDMGLEFIISAPEDSQVANELSSMTTEQRGKLAVTMLTTGMYLADGNTSGFSMNSALSTFLQSEINNITGNALKTLDLSIGLDNTTDASGQMHTDYSFKFAKRFWNNRLKVQIGGKVSSGQEAHVGQNQSFFDNVTMEYRLSPTSNQYVKLFYNQNVYDWLEGYTGEYGGGFIWKRQLDNFWDIFRFWRSEQNMQPMRGGMQQWQRPDSVRTDTTRVNKIEPVVHENR